MNTAEWILVIFLSTALLLFLVLFIVLIAKLIGLTGEVKKIIITGQGIAENVKDMSSIGGIVKTFVSKYTNAQHAHTAKKTTKTSK